jgi:N-methylhydantoinase A
MKAPEGGSLEKAKARVSPCLFRVGGKLESFETPFYRRSELPVEETFPGPAVILQTDSTTLVPPGATARVDWTGNIIIALGGLQ